MMLFLHEQGYDFFSIPKLSYREINFLVDAFIEQQKHEHRMMEKHKHGRFR